MSTNHANGTEQNEAGSGGGTAYRPSNHLLFLPLILVPLMFASILVMLIRQHEVDLKVDQAFTVAVRSSDSTMRDAIEQVRACERHETQTAQRHLDRRTVWIPCVQQGEDRLRSLAANERIPELHHRLEPVEALLRPRFQE